MRIPTPKALWIIFKHSVNDFIDDKGIKLSAALAYYTIFSIPPLLILVTWITGVFYGKEAIEGRIYYQIEGMIGEEAAFQVQEAIKNTVIDHNSGWATAISVIALIMGAMGVFNEIQDSINQIWRLKAKPKKGLIKLLVNRLISFSMIITIGFLMMVSLLLNAVVDIFNAKIQQLFPHFAVYAFYIINLVLMLAIITTLFATIFKVLPDARIRLKDVTVGSVFTTLLFMLGKFAIGLYLGNSNVGSAYGAAGSVIIILVWVYYSAIILFFGAEFTRVFANKFGRPIQPNEYAVFIEHVDVEVKKPVVHK
jgi:membrane protein